MKKTTQSSGFTLIELLVVIAIIGLLSSIVLASLNKARSSARDARRISDLKQIQIALELYYDKYRTYVVSGGGWGGLGTGYLGFENGTTYLKAVTRVLNEEGFLSAPLVDDPIQNAGYMMYVCEVGQVYAISATLEDPSSSNISFIQTTCNGTGANGTYDRYGKNYALANKTY